MKHCLNNNKVKSDFFKGFKERVLSEDFRCYETPTGFSTNTESSQSCKSIKREHYVKRHHEINFDFMQKGDDMDSIYVISFHVLKAKSHSNGVGFNNDFSKLQKLT